MKNNKLRRIGSLLLIFGLLFSGVLSGAIGKDNPPTGPATRDLQQQLTEVWGTPYVLRPIAQKSDGTQIYETMTFTYEADNSHQIFNLHAGTSSILAVASLLAPQISLLWAISSLNCLAGIIAYPVLGDFDHNIAVYHCEVIVSRYTAVENAEPILVASKIISYRCYENIGHNNTERAWVDFDSAQTTWSPTSNAFTALID